MTHDHVSDHMMLLDPNTDLGREKSEAGKSCIRSWSLGMQSKKATLVRQAFRRAVPQSTFWLGFMVGFLVFIFFFYFYFWKVSGEGVSGEQGGLLDRKQTS